MKVGVPKEKMSGERRVALVPGMVPKLTAAGLEVHVERGAGIEAGFTDQQYADNGAHIDPNVLFESDLTLKVRPPSAAEIQDLRPDSILIGLLEPFSRNTPINLLASRNITAFAMELMPRLARAQSMDALSAMSTIAGYKAILLAANRLPKFFPLLMTAAGTIPPARVLVIGAGVAGLEAIGTAKRLGAVVEAYDTRPSVKEEVESIGGKFVTLNLTTVDAGGKGSYGTAQTEDFYKEQQHLMSEHIAAADVIITAALVRGQQAPILVTQDMVQRMRPGSVIVDLAADQGGNCALTCPDQEVVRCGVTILGPSNVPSLMPLHASELYSRTVTNFLFHIFHDRNMHFEIEDQITKATLLTHRGTIFNDAGLKRRES